MLRNGRFKYTLAKKLVLSRSMVLLYAPRPKLRASRKVWSNFDKATAHVFIFHYSLSRMYPDS